MERRNSYSKYIYAPTTATRIADAKNKRETRLLAQTSKGLSCETDGTLRTFFREKAKANDFLQKIHRRSPRMLTSPQCNEHGRLILDKRIGFITGDETKNKMKVLAGGRRLSLRDFSQTEETQKRIQEFLARDFPGEKSRNEEDRPENEFNGQNIEDGFGEAESSDTQQALGSESSGDESSEDDSKTNSCFKNPFKVRSRTSGICFSYCDCQELHLPPINLSNIGRRFSETGHEVGLKFSYNFEKSRRKLNAPIMVEHGQLSVERKRLVTSVPVIPLRETRKYI